MTNSIVYVPEDNEFLCSKSDTISNEEIEYAKELIRAIESCTGKSRNYFMSGDVHKEFENVDVNSYNRIFEVIYTIMYEKFSNSSDNIMRLFPKDKHSGHHGQSLKELTIDKTCSKTVRLFASVKVHMEKFFIQNEKKELINKSKLLLVINHEKTRELLIGQLKLEPEDFVEICLHLFQNKMNLDRDKIMQGSRKRELVYARYIIVSKIDQYYFQSKLSLSRIGQLIGDKDHATILHARKEVTNLLETQNKEFKDEFDDFEIYLDQYLKDGDYIVLNQPTYDFKQSKEIIRSGLNGLNSQIEDTQIAILLIAKAKYTSNEVEKIIQHLKVNSQ